MLYPELSINGMKTESDVCNMIVDTIDSGDLESAKDYVGQFKDYLYNKELIVQVIFKLTNIIFSRF